MADTKQYTFHCRKATVIDGDTGRVVEHFDYPDHHPGVKFELGKPWRGDNRMCAVEVRAETGPVRWWDTYNQPMFLRDDPIVTITIVFTNRPRKWVYNEQLKGWVPQ